MEANIKMADQILMRRCIQGDSLYIYEQFGVDMKNPWCLTVRGKKWFPPSRPLEFDAAECFP